MSQVAVVIPTYNRGHVLPRALLSVAEQTFRDFEIWVVDDGSTDKTSDIIEWFEHNHPEIELHYVRTDNHGVSAARNLAIKESKASWLAFLDSDDEWLPERLERQFGLLAENPTLRLIHGEEIWVRNGRRVNAKNKHRKHGGWIFERCLPLCLVSPSAAMVHRSVFDQVGLFDEEYPVCEDYDLWLKTTLRFEVGFVETPIIRKYGGHVDQLSRRYFAMDYWRVKSLGRMLREEVLYPDEKLAVAQEVMVKTEVLLRGYQKHKNMTDYFEVESIRDLAQRSLPHSRDKLSDGVLEKNTEPVSSEISH